jgi:CO/xanthine dehydrogenase Mo-binding subunit
LNAATDSHRRIEGAAKVSGQTRFTADLPIGQVAGARLVLSQGPAARITGYDLAAARAVPGVIAVVTGEDLPALAMPGPDLPLARGRVFFAGQPVVAVVAESAEAASDAAALVHVEYQDLPAVVDLFEAIKDGAPRVLESGGGFDDDSGAHGTAVAGGGADDHHPNVTASVRFEHGDAVRALAESEHMVRGRWTIPAVHQGFIEPHVTVARAEPDGGYTIWAPTQGVFPTREATARHLGLPLGSVRVIGMAVGGGFGGKMFLLEPLVCLLARIADRPVRLELTRTEEFLMGRGAAGCVIDLELGADGAGNLTAARAQCWFDNGAGSGGLAGIVGLMLGGSYRLPNYDFNGYGVATNKTPNTAYRAPGSPNAFFALESAMDELADLLQVDPIDFRIRHAVREGDPRPDGSKWPRIGLVECLEAARNHPLATLPATPGEAVGVAIGGWPGASSPAAALCRVEPDGTLAVQVGYTDISGTDTTMAMLAAEAFGTSIDKVRIEMGDSSSAPYADFAGGSRTVRTAGLAVLEAAADARRQVLEVAAEELEIAADDLTIEDGVVSVSGVPERNLPVGRVAGLAQGYMARHAPILGRGRSAIRDQAPMFTVHLCRVRADGETGEWRILDYAAIQDVGKVLNRAEIEGQVHGGAMQSLGRALGEQMVWDESGLNRTASFLDYELPTIDQAPPIDVRLVEVPDPQGPRGAKGVGEPPAVPGPGAVANALRRALGRPIRRLPISWESLAGL